MATKLKNKISYQIRSGLARSEGRKCYIYFDKFLLSIVSFFPFNSTNEYEYFSIDMEFAKYLNFSEEEMISMAEEFMIDEGYQIIY